MRTRLTGLRVEWGGLQEYVAEAALKTQGTAIRDEVLHVMNETTDANTRWIAINALRLSPGDQAWLRRAREAIAALRAVGHQDVELDRQKKLAIEWLDARISRPD